MKKLLLKSMLLLSALIVGSGTMWATDYVKVTSSSDLVAGDEYILACTSGNNTYVVTSSFSSNTFATTASGFSVSSSTITISTATPMIITLGGSSTGYTLSYVSGNNTVYVGHYSNDNKLQTGNSATTDYFKWTWNSSNGALVNKGKSARYIGYNGTTGVKSYSTSNYNSYPIACLYKKSSVSATALSVKTAPTKVNYKVGETLDLTGLVLDATVSGNHVDVTSGYTASPANGATLSEVGAKTVTFTYGGQTTTQTIHVGELTGIAITTAPTKTTYNEGQTFDPTGMVVTATFSDGEETPTEWIEDVTDDCTFSPNTALTTSDTNIEVSYTWAEVTKTANQTITVTAGVPYTVTFNAGTGSCGTASLTEASFGAGVTLPTATIGVTGWSFAGWATASTTNTEVAPTLYAASSTYKPTDNITLYAVYEFSYKSSTTFTRATSVSDITSTDKVVIAYNDGKVLNTSINLSTTLSETDSKVTPNANAIFTLSGDNTNGYTLTNGTNTIGTSGSGNSLNIALSSTNNLWTFSSSTFTTNVFHVNNVNASKSLEVYSSAWKAYALTQNGEAWSMRIYVPATDYVYNSNPAAMINPTVAFTTVGNKSLYVQDEASYTNAANVTGINKTPTYTSSDATVATVSEAGVVTALKAGETTITAKVPAEAGVNTEASASYTVTVKDAKTIAGLKTITDASSVVSFTADLNDAVVTYVNGSYAYIQDASGAVYASCGSSLTAGKKINGAVTGSIKAAYKIDEITAIDLSEATVTDGDIPAALSKTVAQLITSGTSLEGQLVQVSGAAVTASLEGNSGGKISDDSKVSEINLYAPNGNIVALKDAEGTFKGYISYYNASTYRLNIYEQSQIALTRNAPTDQPLTFVSDAIELDEETDDYNYFAGQTVSGAKGTVTYSIESNDNGVVTSINDKTGAVVLSGICGSAVIKVSAAATEVTEAGVTTPYKATEKEYTINVYPRYTSTFNINGVVTVARQDNHSASITVPTPAATIGEYHFMGWKVSAIATPTDEAPEMVTPPTTPTSNVTYYAVYAQERAGSEEEVTSTLSLNQSEPANSTSTVNGVTWSWNNLTFATSGNNVGMEKNKNATVTIDMPNNAIKAKRLSLVRSQAWGAATVVVSNSAGEIGSIGQTGDTYVDFTNDNNTSAQYTLSQSTDKNAWISSFTLTYSVLGTECYDYRTSLPIVELTVTASGYLSYCSPYKLDFSETEVKAYKAAVDGEGKVTLTKVDVVPANEGVVLFSSEAKAADEAKTYTIPVTDKAASDVTGNQMVGVLTRTQVFWNPSTDVYNYILQGGEFKKASTGFLKANRAYLSTSYDVTVTSARDYMEIVFEDEPTGIADVRSKKADVRGDVYDLQGRKVNNPKSGLYIVNGRKVYIK